MNKIIVIAISALLAVSSHAALVISNSAATSITTTSMVFNATIASTNGTGTNPTCTVFYGTVDYTTNAGSWAYSNVYGVAGVGAISTNIQGLSTSHKYYFAWRAVEGPSTDWATPSLNAWTKPSSPTSTPAVVTISVQTDTNAALKAPTNFFGANSNLMISALAGTYAGAGDLTSLQNATNALNSTVTNLNNATNALNTRMGTIETGAVLKVDADFQNLLTNTATAAQGTKADNAYPSSNPSNYVTASVTDGVNAVVSGKLPTSDFATHTNNGDGNILHLTAAEKAVATNATSSGTFDHTALTNVNGDANEQHLTAAEKAIATNPPSTNGFVTAAITNDVNSRINDIVAWPTNAWATSGATNAAAGAAWGYDHVTRKITINSNDFGGSGIADASGWSAFGATQPIVWTEVTSIVTNLNVTGTLDPNVTGLYAYVTDYSWNGNIWSNAANGWVFAGFTVDNWYFTPDPFGGGWSPAWERGDVPTSPTGIYNPGAGLTGTVTVAYSYTTNTAQWKAGWDGTNWNISRDGVLQVDATNVATKTMVALSSNSALQKAGGSMAGNIDLAGNTISNGNYVGNGAGLTNLPGVATNAGALGNIAAAVWIGSTSTLNTAVTVNLAAATNALIAATGALNTAVSVNLAAATNALIAATNNLNANKLNASFTNTGILSAVQITGGSPADGSVLKCTNSTGQSAWTLYPKVSAQTSVAFPINNVVIISFEQTNNVTGGTWDGTYWTPGVIGYLAMSVHGQNTLKTDANCQGLIRKNNTVNIIVGVAADNVLVNWAASVVYYNDNVTNKYSAGVYSPLSLTNNNTVLTIFSGAVLP